MEQTDQATGPKGPIVFGHTSGGSGVVFFTDKSLFQKIRDFREILGFQTHVVKTQHGMGLKMIGNGNQREIKDEAGEFFDVPIPNLPEKINIIRDLGAHGIFC